MAKIFKTQLANSLPHAFQLCKKHAAEKHNMSVERIADRIGVTPDTLYKYLGEGRMPARLIIGFEQACGGCFVTQYLALHHGFLMVKIPSGRTATHKQINDLQQFVNEVMGQLLAHASGTPTIDQTVNNLTLLMQDLAYHKGEVEKSASNQRELSL